MELFTPGHLIPLLVLAAILFFGWKQLPDMARSAGRSLRVFRTEVKGMADDDATRAAKSAITAATEASATAPAASAVIEPAATAPAVPTPSVTPEPTTVAPVTTSSAATTEDVVAADAPVKPAG